MAKAQAKAKAPAYYATGRRKTATARVYLARGKGAITVNGLSLEEYFGGFRSAKVLACKPLNVLEMRHQVDVKIFVKGSGPSSQAGAISHGIARALVIYDESGMIAPVVVDVRPSLGIDGVEEAAPAVDASARRKLRRANCLTRDAREVERKKVGHRKARKVEQYSKR
jgi:small subunit ribosomal protein S9